MALHLELIFAVFLAVTLQLETVNAAKPIEVYVVGEQPVSTATPTRSGRANNFTSLKYAMTRDCLPSTKLLRSTTSTDTPGRSVDGESRSDCALRAAEIHAAIVRLHGNFVL